MSSQNQTSVCNVALLSLGVQQQISSLTEGSPQSNACSTLYSFVFQQLARTAKWGCLNKQTALTLIQAAQGTPENPLGTTLPIPQQPWLYAYIYPPDCLLMRQILAPIIPTPGSGELQTGLANSITPGVSGVYAIRYEAAYSTDVKGNAMQVVLTNQENAVANYTVDQENPATWDPLFTSAFCASLAVYLVPALALDKQLMQMQLTVAERIIMTARAMDGNEAVTIQDHVPDWLRSRSGSTGYYCRGSLGYQAYGTMSWPG